MADVEMQSAPVQSALGAGPFPLTLPPDIPAAALAQALGGGEQVTEQRILNPDADFLLAIYRQLLALPDLQKAASDSVAREVEVESLLHDTNRARAEAEERADADRKERDAAKAERDALSAQLADASAQLASLKSTSESGGTHVAELTGRVEAVEQEKRALLASLERERAENAQKSEEIDSLSKRNKETRLENNRLSSELQTAQSAQGTSKFKVQSLEQELELAQKNAAWAHDQLTRANEAATAFRTSKHTEFVNLQAELDSAQQALTAQTTKATGLQNAYEAATTRLEESTAKVADLQTRLASQEESFRTEMATQSRLVTLLERRAEDAQRRTDEVQDQWEEVLQQCKEREEAAREETAREREERERVEAEKDEVQQALDRLAESIGIHPRGEAREDDVESIPGTPQRASSVAAVGLNASFMSPTAALAGRVQKSGMSFTQVYTDLARTQEELRRQRAEYHRLDLLLQEVMGEIEERGPQLQAQRDETERLSADLGEMSKQLARACQDRDVAEKDAKAHRLDAERVSRENSIMTQQLADLGRQVRHLTREVILRDDPSAASRLQDDGTDIPDSTAGDANDTQAVITSQLVTFSSLTDLCAQNARLLRVTRELGARMESEESAVRERLEQSESEAVAEAHALIVRLQDEIKAERARVESARSERDMFRSMAAGTGPRGANGSATSDDNARHQDLLNRYTQLQSQFDAFRTETSLDADRLKADVQEARAEAGRAVLAAARETAAKESAIERNRTLAQTVELERSDLAIQRRRADDMQNSFTRRDIAAHATEEALLNAQTQLEQLRNETSNLRAEKELWKGTESRLLEEVAANRREKDSLNEYLRSMQTLQGEVEREGSAAKRNLEAQVAQLEEASTELKQRLAKQEDETTQTNARRELETRELQRRYDQVSSDLATAREQLAVAKTSAEHLTTRVDDLSKQLQSKEEKLAVYERRASTVPGSSGLDRAQTLEMEIADLRGELRSAQVEAEKAREHVEHFRAIAQANEDALGELQTTYDTFRKTMEEQVSSKDAEIQSLRSRLEALGNELTSAQTEVGELHVKIQSQTTEFATEKRSLEDAIAQLSNVEDRARGEQEELQAALRKQRNAVHEKQTKYQAEVIAHAEALDQLKRARDDLSNARAEVKSLRTRTETAEANLASNQGSWDAQKQVLLKEVEEHKKRVDEVNAQNAILHQHLESVNTQASQIRQAAASSDVAEVADGDTSLSGHGHQELREVITYLRREKEIVDLQMEISKQEVARLRQSLEHTSVALDETRTELAAERSRNAGVATSAQQQQELLEKINQVSILRESNVTLREEAERAKRRVNTLENQLATARSELEPLRDQLRSTGVELEACQSQITVLQDDNKRWQARAQSILQQYNRIDPEELKVLEERAQAAETALQAKNEELAAVLRARDDMQTHAKTRFDRLREQAKRIQDSSNARAVEMTELQALLERTQEELRIKTAEAEAAAAQQQVAQSNTANESTEALRVLTEERDALLQRVAALEEAAAAGTAAAGAVAEGGAATEQAIAEAVENAKKEWESEAATLRAREKKHLEAAKNLFREKKHLAEELTKVKAQLEAAAQAQGPAGTPVPAPAPAATTETAPEGADGETIESLKSRIAELEEALRVSNEQVNTLQQALAAANAAATAPATSNGDPATTSAEIEQLKATHVQEMQEQEAHMSQRYAAQQKQAIEVAVRKAVAAHKHESGGADVEEEVQKRLQALEEPRRQEQQQAVERAVAQRETELSAAHEAALKANYDSGYQSGKSEAELRNQLLIKMRDTQIARLKGEVAELKGGNPDVPAAVQSAAATAAPASAFAPAATSPTTQTATTSILNSGAAEGTPGVISIAGRGRGGGGVGRGGAPAAAITRTTPGLPAGPLAAAAPEGAIRGGARGGRGALRGRRGGPAALAAAAAAAAASGPGVVGGVAKRKLGEEGSGDQGAGAGAEGGGNAGPAAKRGRAAGGPIAINRPGVNRPGGSA